MQLVKKFPAFLWNPEVHYRTHKRPPPVPILGQPNAVHIPTSHLLEIHPNNIHPSTPRSSQWSLSLRFPHQDPIPPSPHPYAPHAQPISFFSILSPAQYKFLVLSGVYSSAITMMHGPINIIYCQSLHVSIESENENFYFLGPGNLFFGGGDGLGVDGYAFSKFPDHISHPAAQKRLSQQCSYTNKTE